MDSTYVLSRTDSLFAPSHLRSGDGAPSRSPVFFWPQLQVRAGVSFGIREAMVYRAHGTDGEILCLLRSDWSLRWLVCIFRMRLKKGSRLVKDVVSWPRKLVVSRNGQGSREAPSPSVPGPMRFAPMRQMSIWKVRVRMSMKCLLPEGRVARTSLTFRCHFWIPRNGDWRRTMVFFREKNIIVLEARSILYAVRYAENN